MEILTRLFDLVSPHRHQSTQDAHEPRTAPATLTRAERLLLAAVALLAAIGLGALWGVAAGSHDHHLAVDNVGKVPVLLLASSLVALPIGVFVFRLMSRGGRATDIVIAHAVAIFAGCLALALLSPLVALYQYSSSFAGMPVAIGSVILAATISFGVLVRVLRKLAPDDAGRAYGVPVGVVIALQLAALAQLASITTPVFPTRTTFGRGVDGIVQASPGSDAQ